MRDIGVGIIGTGFMGRAHAIAYRAARGIMPVDLNPVLVVVADNNVESGRKAAAQLGFGRMTADWQDLIADPQVEIVSIATPNTLHKEMALAAIAAGKHVHCEKPLAPGVADAKAMMEAAELKGIVTQVGYNYIKNPILGLARDMIASSELGDIYGFRGIHAEDYMSDPDAPYTWRLDPAGGGGVIADLGSHIIGMARFLLGPIAELSADLETVVKTRPVAPGASERREIKVDDIARLTLRFARGSGGTIEANWVASGRTMQLGFEVFGAKGAIAYSQEHLNELLCYKPGAARAKGFTRIEAGPAHAPYGNFCVAAGHQLGFNDLKTIEVADFLAAIAGGPRKGPDFREAWEIQKVVDTAIRSSREKAWLRIA